MKSFERLYLKLFSAPSLWMSFIISVALVLALSFFYFKVIAVWLTLTISLTAAVKFLNLKFNLRRILFMSLITTIVSFLSQALFSTPSGSIFLFLAVLYFCSSSNLLKVSAYTGLVYLILAPNVSTIALLLLSALSLAIYLRLLDKNVGNFNIREFVESFVLFWLTSKPVYIEQTLVKSSERFSGKVRCLKIGEARIISTDFHPGPFRNVGGAKLISKIFGIPNAIYLHSPTSHARNPVTEEDVETIVSAITCEGEKVIPMKPFTISGKNFEVICFPFSKIRLIFVSGKEKIDDFLITSGQFVVDCHNAYFRGFDMGYEHIEEVKQLVKKAEEVQSSPSTLKYALYRERVSTESICEFVAVLLLDYTDVKYALVVFDSNNVLMEFRKFVETKFREVGFEAIVVSTDNHSRTGIKTKVGYKPAGGDEKDWKLVEKLARVTSTLNMTEAECNYSEKLVEANVMGEKFLKNSDFAAKTYSMKYILLSLIHI